jgi:hypothetical protein
MTDKIPQSVSIGGRTIGIVVEEMESWGEYRSDDKQIAISHKATLSELDLIETLRHEMVHAALDIGGISHIKNYEEEAIVRCLDTIFHGAWEQVRKSLTE